MSSVLYATPNNTYVMLYGCDNGTEIHISPTVSPLGGSISERDKMKQLICTVCSQTFLDTEITKELTLSKKILLLMPNTIEIICPKCNEPSGNIE